MIIKQKSIMIRTVVNGWIVTEVPNEVGMVSNELAVFNSINDMNNFIVEFYLTSTKKQPEQADKDNS